MTLLDVLEAADQRRLTVEIGHGFYSPNGPLVGEPLRLVIHAICDGLLNHSAERGADGNPLLLPTKAGMRQLEEARDA